MAVNRKTIEKFRDLMVALFIALVSLLILTYSYGAIIRYQFGTAYPANHVYQALLAANAKIREVKAQGKYFDGYDITGEFRRATAGEPFNKIVDEFQELGMPDDPKTHYFTGKDYLLRLRWPQIAKLKIPDFAFWSADRVDFEVRILKTEKDYRVLNCKIVRNPSRFRL